MNMSYRATNFMIKMSIYVTKKTHRIKILATLIRMRFYLVKTHYQISMLDKFDIQHIKSKGNKSCDNDAKEL